MNARGAALCDRALELLLLAAAFAAPLAAFSHAFDPALVKTLTVQCAAAGALALLAARALEAGRFELPEGRGAAAGLAAAWLAASAWLAGSPAAALAAAAGPALLLAALLGPASTGFAARLAGALAWAAAASSVAGAAPSLEPHALGVLCAAALPLALTRACEPGAWRPAAALSGAAAALCLWGVARSGSAPGHVALLAGGLVMLAGGLSWARTAELRWTSAAAGAAAAAAALLARWDAGFEAQWLSLTAPDEPGRWAALAAAVLAAAAALGRGRSALRAGEASVGALLLGHAAALSALAAAAAVSPSTDAAVPGLALWLLAGSALGLCAGAGARVRVGPLPLALWPRRAAYLPAAALLALALSAPARLFVSDLRYNRALAAAEARPQEALELLAGVWDGSPLAARSRLAEAALHRRRGPDGTEAALAAYRRAAALAPERAGIWRAVGRLEAESERWEAARAALAEAARLDARDAESWRLLVEASARLGLKDEALAAARGLVRAAPYELSSWSVLAERCRESKLYAESRRAEKAGRRLSEVQLARARGRRRDS